MAKIPFTLDAWLKDKSQKIETRSGENVRIICWDKKGVPIFAQVGDADDIVTYNRDGQQMQLPSDLFIITPEPELSEFEKRIRFIIDEVVDGRYNADNIEDVKGIAKGLLALAREQIIKDGYVIEKKAFHDAVEKVALEVMKEVSENVDKANEELTEFEQACMELYNEGRDDGISGHNLSNESVKESASELLTIAKKEIGTTFDKAGEYLRGRNDGIEYGKAEVLKEIEQDPESSYDAFKRGFEYGKEEALKDLPRWDDCWRTSLIDKPAIINQFLIYKGRKIILADLEKLPGFKEDESHE